MGKAKRKRPRIDLEEEEGAGSSATPSSGASTRGPPVATTSGRLSGAVPNDEWQTCERSWAAVASHFSAWRAKRVWMPFYYDGACAAYLRRLGFKNVVHTNDDFFERVADKRFMASIDLVWDNPPYTTSETKERVLRALAACGKPWAMLLPISVLHVAFVRDVVDMDSVQAIVPRRVWVRKTGEQHAHEQIPFKCAWPRGNACPRRPPLRQPNLAAAADGRRGSSRHPRRSVLVLQRHAAAARPHLP